ncbi:MAG: hypothetical protein JWP06_1132 [Candidatus Saccharibacteria bacterium]|nr:hypothetical protein [Candidatus Saccharibacteria bacterium]
MTNPNTPQVLNPGRFVTSIRHDSEFLGGLPKAEYQSMPQDQKRESMQRAIAAGALSIAERLEKEHGEYDLDANLYKLVAGLDDFHRGSVAMDQLRDEYGSPHYMPPPEKQDFYDHKDKITEFNHVLREVINAGASRFNFDELLIFMTNMYIASSGSKDAQSFHAQARMTIVGMRNEVAIEQLMIAAGVEYNLGTAAQDSVGGDIVIQGVLIDVKASEKSAEKAKQKAKRSGRNQDRIVWSHIEFADYEGGLMLPYKKNDEILQKLLPDLRIALASEQQQLSA